MEDLDQFRLEVRAWLAANCPASQRQPMRPEEQYWGGRRGTFASADAQLWFERMRDKGWTAPEWPTQYGGGGLSPQQARVLKEEMKSIHARTPLYGIGLWMLGPAVLEYGNEATETATHSRHRQRREPLVPGLLRTRRRLRPGQPAVQGGGYGRPLPGQRQ